MLDRPWDNCGNPQEGSKDLPERMNTASPRNGTRRDPHAPAGTLSALFPTTSVRTRLPTSAPLGYTPGRRRSYELDLT